MSSNTINPKPCNYLCGIRIYWNTLENAYFEVFSKKKHVCPNRSKSSVVDPTNTYKPTYYKKKSFYSTKEPTPKMSNSLELLQGTIQDIQMKYEVLSDIVSEANGKVHGSQSHIIANNLISLFIYYEVPQGRREEVKQRVHNHFVYNQNYL